MNPEARARQNRARESLARFEDFHIKIPCPHCGKEELKILTKVDVQGPVTKFRFEAKFCVLVLGYDIENAPVCSLCGTQVVVAESDDFIDSLLFRCHLTKGE